MMVTPQIAEPVGNWHPRPQVARSLGRFSWAFASASLSKGALGFSRGAPRQLRIDPPDGAGEPSLSLPEGSASIVGVRRTSGLIEREPMRL